MALGASAVEILLDDQYAATARGRPGRKSIVEAEDTHSHLLSLSHTFSQPRSAFTVCQLRFHPTREDAVASHARDYHVAAEHLTEGSQGSKHPSEHTMTLARCTLRVAPAPAPTGGGIDFAAVRHLISGTQLSPGAASLMHMVEAQQQQQVARGTGDVAVADMMARMVALLPGGAVNRLPRGVASASSTTGQATVAPPMPMPRPQDAGLLAGDTSGLPTSDTSSGAPTHAIMGAMSALASLEARISRQMEVGELLPAIALGIFCGVLPAAAGATATCWAHSTACGH